MVGENLGKGYVFVFILLAVSVALEHDTPLIHYLKPVWEIHLYLIQLATRSHPESSLS
jgi:hypothetical protein